MAKKTPSTMNRPASTDGIRRFFAPIARTQPSRSVDHTSDTAIGAVHATQSPAARPAQSSTTTALDDRALSAATAPASQDDQDNRDIVDDVDNVADAHVSAYERKRLARVAMNAQLLHALGVKAAHEDVTQALAPARLRHTTTTNKNKKMNKKRAREAGTVAATDVIGTRRSSRLQGVRLVEAPAAGIAVNDDGVELERPSSYNDSSVFTYTCSGRGIDVHATERRGQQQLQLSDDAATLVGFRATGETLADPNLRRIYSMDFSPFCHNTLIAAGGHQGHVSIYPSPAMKKDHEGDDATLPLLSFRAHRGWISSLSLAKSTAHGQNWLLSAANDGVVKLWDLNRSAHGVPKEMLCVDDLHRNGIFGMDVSGETVLTCSKDATIALSQFRDGASALTVTQRYDAHDGVVKSARFAPVHSHCFASGGNDRSVRIFDTRSRSDTASQQIQNAHERAINSVVWHPNDEHLLLSASFDPEMHLYDLRKPAAPLHVLLTSATRHAGNAIFHPCFVADGSFVVATGAGAQDQLSLHRTSDGSIVSRGQLPSKASFIARDPWSGRLLVAMGQHLQFYDAEWQNK